MAAVEEAFQAEKLIRKMRGLRELHAYTQQEVAQQLHVERSTYTWYELGRVIPKIDTLVRLASLYGVSVDCLLDIDREWTAKELAYRLFQFFKRYFQETEKRHLSVRR